MIVSTLVGSRGIIVEKGMIVVSDDESDRIKYGALCACQ